MRKIIPVFVSLLFLGLLVGCGGNQQQPAPEATTPIANAGTDQNVYINLQCQLDGSLSSGNLATYTWRIKSLPASATTPAVVSADSKKAYFIPTTTGAYEFELVLNNSLGSSIDAVAITVNAFQAPSLEAGFFGICDHLPSHDGQSATDLNTNIQMLKELGTQFVRFDFDWKEIETADDGFSFSKYDDIVDKLTAQNIKILGILDYGNNWSDPTTGNTTEINRFADYVVNTVRHFKNKVKIWQIWNEPNNELFWPSPNAANYAKLLQAAYAAAKQADPQSVVVLGGLVGNGQDEIVISGIRFASANFLSGIYSNNGKDCFDVVAIHPYNYTTDISSTASLVSAIDGTKTIMSNNGDGSKELWITELGPLLFPPTAVPLISTRGYSEAEIATWLNLIYTDLKPKVQKLFWYEFRDFPGDLSITNPNWEGLVKSDFTPKQAFTTYKNLPK